MKKITIIFISIIFCAYPLFADENIYSWTDDKGVKHFSNQKPHSIIEYDKAKAIPASPESDKIRPGYVSMAEDAKETVRQHEIEIKEEKIRRAEEEKQRAEKEKLEKKIAELSEKIEKLEDRPTGYYTGYPVIKKGHVQGYKQGNKKGRQVHPQKAYTPKYRHPKRHKTEAQKQPEK